ncbi:MAG: VWA domain-containing protein [Acidobacteriota bacterium]
MGTDANRRGDLRGVPTALALGWVLAFSFSSGSAQSTTKTFRTAVDVTTVDVLVVNDRDGRPIIDLKADDFIVEVDGKRRALASADLLTYGVWPAAIGPMSEAQTTAVSAPPPLTHVLPARWFVLAIDTANTAVGGGRSVASAASAFLDRLPPEDYVGLVALPTGVAVEFTKDRGSIRAGLTKVVGSGANKAETIHNVSLAEAYSFVTGRQPGIWNAAVRSGCYQEDAKSCLTQMESEARFREAAARSAAHMAVSSLTGLLDKLSGLEAPKQVILVSESLVTGSRFGAIDGPDLRTLAVAAQRARAHLFVLHVDHAVLDAVDVAERFASRTSSDDMAMQRDGLQEVAAATGAGYFRLTTTLDPAFDRIVRETSAGYLLAFQTIDSDRDGKAHQLVVRVNRPDVTIRARRQFVASRRADGSPGGAFPAGDSGAARPPEPTAPARDTTPPLSDVSVVAPSAAVPVPTVVQKATAYLAGYLRTLSSVVSEEQYEQRLERPQQGRTGQGSLVRTVETQRRDLTSDVLLVQLPGIRGWYEFRDVFRVDGTVVRDRNDRLIKLFVEPHANRLAQADQILEESSRHNIGDGVRDTNLPTFALQFLLPAVIGKLTFRLQGSELVDGKNAQIVVYNEVARPTMIRGDGDSDVPATGQFWIDPETGAVVKTRVETKSGSVRTRIDVTYRLEPKLGISVPALMEERREAAGEVLQGRATYGNFRRFTVGTVEEIKKHEPAEGID